MQIIGLIIGILVILGMLLGFLPFLGWLNWFNIAFASFGLIISVISILKAKNKGIGIAGIILCAIAILIGIGRLQLGGGFF
jgi:hypothetical protein